MGEAAAMGGLGCGVQQERERAILRFLLPSEEGAQQDRQDAEPRRPPRATPGPVPETEIPGQ